MHNFLALLIGFTLSMPAYTAGLGTNPFERNSPTSATGTAKPKPVTPAAPAPPATPVAPAPKPSSAPIAPSKQDSQTQKSSSSQGKK